MSFLRHGEIYRSDGRKAGSNTFAAPSTHRLDEFPAGYSLAGCSPAEPASASPAANDSPQGQAPRKNFSSNGNYPLNFVSHDKGSLHAIRESHPCQPIVQSHDILYKLSRTSFTLRARAARGSVQGMAWKTVDVQEQRIRFVVEATQGLRPFSALCAAYRISRPTGVCGCNATEHRSGGHRRTSRGPHQILGVRVRRGRSRCWSCAGGIPTGVRASCKYFWQRRDWR